MAVAAVIAGASACNSSTEEYHVELDGSAIVKGFSLVENDKVLADLDSVYFSIDLVNGDIFNADSLPMGTRIKALAANITTDNASAVTLYIPRPGMSDSVVNYLENSADTIDFSNGPVRVEVTSLSGATTKSYRVRINVHTIKSDSLCWGSTAIAPLPAVSGANAQRTVQQGSAFYTFSTDGSRYSVAATSDMASWQPAIFTPGFDMDVNTVTATPQRFYALATDGTLYAASAAGGPWVSEGLHFTCLYGAYGDDVVGLCTDVNGHLTVLAYPSGHVTTDMPDDFPVSGFSPAVTLTTSTSSGPQMLITGGRDVSGALTGATFGYDGTAWARISMSAIPEGLEGVAVAPYYTLRNQIVEWRVDVYPSLLAIGGRKTDGSINETVYMSRDWGLNWQKADSLMQPGNGFPRVYAAQAPVAPRTLSVARGASVWRELGGARLPLGARPEGCLAASRAVAPVTEWDAPYVYLFGGYDAAGRLNDGVWRGVINRFTFTPIQ